MTQDSWLDKWVTKGTILKAEDKRKEQEAQRILDKEKEEKARILKEEEEVLEARKKAFFEYMNPYIDKISVLVNKVKSLGLEVSEAGWKWDIKEKEIHRPIKDYGYDTIMAKEGSREETYNDDGWEKTYHVRTLEVYLFEWCVKDLGSVSLAKTKSGIEIEAGGVTFADYGPKFEDKFGELVAEYVRKKV